MENEEFNEKELKKAKAEQKKSIRNQEIGSLYGAYKEKHNQKDIDALNNRTGKNENFKNEDEEENNNEKSSSSLEEKEGLNQKTEDNKSLDEEKNSESKDSNDKNQKTEDKKQKINPKNTIENVIGLTALKNKFFSLELKLKIALILCCIFGGLFIILLIVIILIMTIDNFTSSVVNFFGIPESDTKENASLSEADGLYTNENYFYDENGNELNSEDLVNNLKNSNNCKITLWNSITDTLNGSKFKDPCEFMRYVENHVKGKQTDVGLVIATVFYGFDSQPFAGQYNNQKDALNSISASNHYEAFKKMLTENDFINESSLNSIINSTISNGTYYYYTWEITDENEKNNDTTETNLDEINTDENSKKLIGKCVSHKSGSNKYSLDKWKIFMRFGERIANMYDQIIRDSMAYNSSDAECNGSVSDDELINRIKASANDNSVEIELDTNSVNTARNALKNGSSSIDLFTQSANVDTKTKDTFQSYQGEVFDYRNGFAYTHFPYFIAMENKNDKIDLIYDEVYTPKEIETIILEIINRKSDLNDVLMLSDLDDNGLSYADNMTSVITGASCGNYLSVESLDDITVRLTDCNGKFLANVPFDDYIIGVANAEVSNTNDNYVLSEMVAAISYALKRHNNYTKGNVINMRSGTCDQAYCNMNKGCSVVPAPNVCSACSSFLIGGNSKAYPDLYPKYKALYEKASDYLLVSNGTVHNAHYTSSIQNEWSRKANAGMSFTQIMQETYADEGAELIRCSESDSTASNSSTPSSKRVGNKATTEYPEVSPDYGEYYGFSYNDAPEGRNITMNPEWKNANLTTVSTNCSAANWNQTMKVNVKAKSKFEDAFKRTCTILTDGVKLKNGKVCKLTKDHINFGGSFVERKTSSGSFSLHAYGLAVDFNYTSKYNINGTIYSPYDSSRSLENYMKFVEALGGDEEDCRNVNYILWKYAFEPAGFTWGGNWGRNGNSATYDGMHFEVKY